MKASRFNEIEYKYRVKGIEIFELMQFVKANLGGTDFFTIAGTDFFFSRGPGEFMRFRRGDRHGELTIKSKTEVGNSWNRVEVDLPLDSSASLEDVIRFAELAGFEYSFNIMKENFIIYCNGFNVAYYIVNDTDEYIEIEAAKVEQDTNAAFTKLNAAEDLLGSFGVSKAKRSSKSLFEIYGGK